jgi:hypothetical protein
MMQKHGQTTNGSKVNEGSEAEKNRQNNNSPEPESPAFDKKLDGPNRPST